MSDKTSLIGLGVAVAVIAAGCVGFGQGTDRVSIRPNVTTAGMGDEVRYDVTLDTSKSTQGYQWTDVTVTGVGTEETVVCRFGVEEIDSDTSLTRSVTCDRVPLAFTVRSEGADEPPTSDTPVVVTRIGRVSDTDTLLTYRSVALVNVTPDGPVYREPPELASNDYRDVGLFDYARCKLRENGVDGSAFDTPAPWLEWVAEQSTVSRTVIRLEKHGDGEVRSGNRTLDPVSLPEVHATAPVRSAIRRARANDTDRTGYSTNASRRAVIALHETLLGQEPGASDRLGLRTIPRVANDDAASHAAGVATTVVEARDSCATTPGDLRVNGSIDVTYAVTVEGEVWEIEIVSDVSWTAEPAEKPAP